MSALCTAQFLSVAKLTTRFACQPFEGRFVRILRCLDANLRPVSAIVMPAPDFFGDHGGHGGMYRSDQLDL